MASVTEYPGFEDWLAALPEDERQKALDLVRALKELGAQDAEGWARSEVSENIPQLTRFLLLRRIWPDFINIWSFKTEEWVHRQIAAAEKSPNGHFADAGAALKRMVEAGVAANDIASLVRMVAYETAFNVMHLIDEGHDAEASEQSPGWILMETNTSGEITGRDVGGLHESLLTMDPSGREGRRAP